MRRLAVLILRAICWATLLGAGLTGLFVALSSKEVEITSRTLLSLFRVMWALAFVPSFVAELLNAHLGVELGTDSDRR